MKKALTTENTELTEKRLVFSHEFALCSLCPLWLDLRF